MSIFLKKMAISHQKRERESERITVFGWKWAHFLKENDYFDASWASSTLGPDRYFQTEFKDKVIETEFWLEK